jgi:hypothetical protein
MSLQRVSYIDPNGMKKVVLLPEGAPESEAARGIPVGPPDLSSLGLPYETQVRLNNELHARGIIDEFSATRGRQDIVLALMSVFKVDANSIVELFVGKDESNAHETSPASPEEQSNPAVHNRRSRQPR